MGNSDAIIAFLKSVAPKPASNSEIVARTGIRPHAQVFQITRDLMRKGSIKGRQFGNEWSFWIDTTQSSPPTTHITSSVTQSSKSKSALSAAAAFEALAQRIMSEHYGVRLAPRRVPGIPKKFDLVSDDGQIIGDAKFYTLVRGIGSPPAKNSVIAEYVWLLEKAKAKHRFLVFGNDPRVPTGWLRIYSHLATEIDFYFISAEGELSKLQ